MQIKLHNSMLYLSIWKNPNIKREINVYLVLITCPPRESLLRFSKIIYANTGTRTVSQMTNSIKINGDTQLHQYRRYLPIVRVLEYAVSFM